MDPLEEIPLMGTLIQMNNSQNYSSDIPESPSLIELLNWNNDDVVTLLDDLSLNNINTWSLTIATSKLRDQEEH
ncbi:hypothetical protein H5410_030688 [Solanum commersonii]|uniref:Uncharacterized protein n=1 Tax=Solanum commersonii TaxID=4109 RepID=A0A9J5YK33_SOLCO|nr:hypothetical protein H5410_030688 [Solanum commersonii]